MAAQKIEENKEVIALKSYPLHEKLLIITIMKSPNISTGDVYSVYKSFCKKTHQNELTQRRTTQMLSEIELSGLISGRMVHQGIHGNTKKFNLTIPNDLVRNTLNSEPIFEDIL